MTTTAPASTQATHAPTALARTQQQQRTTVQGRSPHAPFTAAIRHGYWRITAADGRVLGNVEQLDAADAAGDTSFVARRFHVASATYLPLGRFHSKDDAVDAFRV
ncbi:hypothetical protein [Plantibacter sp. YIM 135347]|uniref:hypothetical protein n=1 Tax=Plantibacter sp. YIM 135347 TaxID=3423919 RepID=UPI003D354560